MNSRIIVRFNFIFRKNGCLELTFLSRSNQNCLFKKASSLSLSLCLYYEQSEVDSSGAEQHSSAESSSKTALPCGSDFSTFELPVRCLNVILWPKGRFSCYYSGLFWRPTSLMLCYAINKKCGRLTIFNLNCLLAFSLQLLCSKVIILHFVPLFRAARH